MLYYYSAPNKVLTLMHQCRALRLMHQNRAENNYFLILCSMEYLKYLQQWT